MHFPYALRRVNRVVTNPIIGTFAWLVPPFAIVHHRGRKSAKPYRSPVVAFPSATGFVVPMTYGRDVDWARNLVAGDGGTIEQLGRRVAVRQPRIVGIDDAYEQLPPLVRDLLRLADFPGYVLVDRAGVAAAKRARPAAKRSPQRSKRKT
ncbi:MAG TPA: nitroreductase family deazaflavin-dependent oxidoreductase [Terriglobales bacterium]|nr:nitroreductase family deazaflavin-dependent oxidoreductase [Terriglobales bacterium]